MQPNKQTTLVLAPQNIVPTTEEEILRVVPLWASAPHPHVMAVLRDAPPRGPAAALRVIRHRLERWRADGLWTLGVTSARDGEGKSTLAAQLALVLGEAQRARVLLVEANMRRPSLARLLGCRVPPGFGFSAQLARRMRGGIEPWAVLALGPSLHVLVENESEPGFPETLNSKHFGVAIERLGRSYDWVVVDTPSVLDSGDANVVEEAVDGMIVVARSRSSKGTDVRSAVRQLGDRKSLGVVLWDAMDAGAR